MYGIEKTNKFNRLPTSYAVWYYNVLLVTPGIMIIAKKSIHQNFIYFRWLGRRWSHKDATKICNIA